jgi:hypothetical protein
MDKRRVRSAILVVACLAASVARAGFEANTYRYESRAQAELSTHILVGTIRAFHRIKPERQPGTDLARRSMDRFIAELDVARVEKGRGIQAGDVVYVRFHAPKTIDEVEHPFQGSDCGLVDSQITPGLANEARIYVKLDDSFEYVADYPRCFFRIRPADVGAPESDVLRFIRARPLATATGLGASGLAIGFVAGRRMGRSNLSRSGEFSASDEAHPSIATIDSP